MAERWLYLKDNRIPNTTRPDLNKIEGIILSKENFNLMWKSEAHITASELALKLSAINDDRWESVSVSQVLLERLN